MHRIILSFSAACLCLVSQTARTANVIWQSPQIVSGASDVSTAGVYFGSWAPHGAGAELLPVNGVTFHSNSLPNFTINSWFANKTNIFGSPGTPNANYNTLLQSARYSDNGTAGSFSWGGLIVGHTYQVQLWVEDMRNIGARRWENAYGDEGSAGQSGALDFPADGTGRGHFVIGQFTADTPGQTISLNTWSTVGGMQCAQVNLFQVRDVTPVPSQSVIVAPGDDFNANTASAVATLQQWYNGSGLWNSAGWWNAAQCIEAIESHVVANNDLSHLATLQNTFSQNSGGDFLNNFYDDEGWWAHAWIRAYDLTGNTQYLDMAKTIFADMTGGWGNPCGGGIWWDRAQTYKNAVANEVFLLTAIRLHQRTPGDGGPGSYFYWATNEWSWFKASGMINAQNLVNDGLNSCTNNLQPTWTYNQGVIIGGLTDLYKATGNSNYLLQAEAIADAAISTLVGVSGILTEPSPCNPTCGGTDVPQFKGIFIRNLAYLYDVNRKPAYLHFLFANARSVWTKARNSSNQLGMSWAGPFDSSDAVRQSSAIMALSELAVPTTSQLPFAKGSGDWAFNHSVGMPTGTLAWACSPAIAGQAGIMQAGPYLSSLPTGAHTAHFRMAVNALNSSSANLVSFDVRENGIIRASGVAPWNAFAAVNQSKDFRLPFTNLVAGGSLEFRVNWNQVSGAPTLILSDVTVDGDRNWVAANLTHDIGRLDGHNAWCADPVRDAASGYLTRGPGATELSPGAWKAEFELKVDNFNRDNSTVATLSVVDVDANQVVAARDLARNEFPNARYRTFDLSFQAVAGVRYDFRVYWNYASTAPRLTQRSVVLRGAGSGNFAPIALTPGSYTHDMVVEKTAPNPPALRTTASMDAGVSNTGTSWYEQGYNAAALATGLPAPSSVITNAASTDHIYAFAPAYNSNNVAMVDLTRSANLVPATPGVFTALSLLTSAGHGPVVMNYRVDHADGSSETGLLSSPDWFFNTPVAFNAQGRVDVVTGFFNSVNNNNPRLYGVDILLTNISSPVTNVNLSWGTGNSMSGVAAIFALSGVAVQPTLDIRQSGGKTLLSWSYGTLLEAPEITGPWTTNTTAVSPYEIQSSNPRRFYRLQAP